MYLRARAAADFPNLFFAFVWSPFSFSLVPLGADGLHALVSPPWLPMQQGRQLSLSENNVGREGLGGVEWGGIGEEWGEECGVWRFLFLGFLGLKFRVWDQ